MVIKNEKHVGWSYGTTFSNMRSGSIHSKWKKNSFVRRRRWIRKRNFFPKGQELSGAFDAIWLLLKLQFAIFICMAPVSLFFFSGVSEAHIGFDVANEAVLVLSLAAMFPA